MAVTEAVLLWGLLIRVVNNFSGRDKSQSKLKIVVTEAPVDFYSVVVTGKRCQSFHSIDNNQSN